MSFGSVCFRALSARCLISSDAPIFSPPPNPFDRFNFDYDAHREVLRAVEGYCESTRIPYYNFEIRTTRQDDAMLSCCQGRDAMWIDFQAKADVSREFFDEMQSMLHPFGFRKHWAKGMATSHDEVVYLAGQFPRASEFVGLMKAFDPRGKFRNAQAEAWFRVMDGLVGEKMDETAHTISLSDTEHSFGSKTVSDTDIMGNGLLVEEEKKEIYGLLCRS